MTNEELAALLTKLDGEATPGNLASAEKRTLEEVVDCPMCGGEGSLDADTYTNIDGAALGVQFFGIGNEHIVQQELWEAYRNHHAQIVAGLAALGELERIRAEIHGGALVPISEWNITIAERDALKVVLQPFADACAEADASSENVRRAGMGHGHSDDASPGWGIRYKHLKAARAALQPAKEKT